MSPETGNGTEVTKALDREIPSLDSGIDAVAEEFGLPEEAVNRLHDLASVVLNNAAASPEETIVPVAEETENHKKKLFTRADIQGDEQLLTPSEVAQLMRVNPKTVTRWARAGEFGCIRTLGGHRRFVAAEILKAMDEANRRSE